MAVGDEAKAAGYSVVPDTGEEGRVRWGAREINRTRDMVAQVKATVPITRDQFRAGVKINSGYGIPGPNDGQEGEIWFRIL